MLAAIAGARLRLDDVLDLELWELAGLLGAHLEPADDAAGGRGGPTVSTVTAARVAYARGQGPPPAPTPTPADQVSPELLDRLRK